VVERIIRKEAAIIKYLFSLFLRAMQIKTRDRREKMVKIYWYEKVSSVIPKSALVLPCA